MRTEGYFQKLIVSILSNSASEGGDGNHSTPVLLNVYDLTPLNTYTYYFGLGIFHSGVEVHGMEYGFGAHDFPTSGVFEVEPRRCPGFSYRCSIRLGTLNMPPLEFRTFMENMASEYHGDTYDLISKNCNHFTEDVCFRLTGTRIPGWVNRLARLGAMCSCLLPETFQVTSVKQLPDYHVYSDGSDTLSNSPSEPVDLGELDSDVPADDKYLLSPPLITDVSFIEVVNR